jgi:anti-sigma regulatory factor (Ser/Thr protein kinase)
MSVVRVVLPRSPDSVAAARRLVDGHSGGLTMARQADAGLMVSELVTNALRHGEGIVTVAIEAGPDALRVEVADEGHGHVGITSAAGAAGGWGLRIVEELADGWGATVGSTRVWFRLQFHHA